MLAPLLELTPLMLYAIGFMVCAALAYFTKAFFGVTGTKLGKLPIVGGWLDATAHHISQRLSNTFGDLAARFEGRVGASWHSMARLWDHLGHEIASHAALLSQMAMFLPGTRFIVTLYRDIAALWDALHRQHKQVVGIGNDVQPRIKKVERGIGSDVMPRLRHVEKEWGRVVNRDLPGIRAGQRHAEREITNLWKWTRTHGLVAGSLAFAGAVSVALSRLGLGFLNCKALSRLGNRIGCGGFGAADELLFGAVTALALTDICDFAAAAYTLGEELQPLLIELVDVQNALIGCHGASAPPQLRLARLSLPAVTDPLPLAA